MQNCGYKFDKDTTANVVPTFNNQFQPHFVTEVNTAFAAITREEKDNKLSNNNSNNNSIGSSVTGGRGTYGNVGQSALTSSRNFSFVHENDTIYENYTIGGDFNDSSTKRKRPFLEDHVGYNITTIDHDSMNLELKTIAASEQLFKHRKITNDDYGHLSKYHSSSMTSASASNNSNNSSYRTSTDNESSVASNLDFGGFEMSSYRDESTSAGTSVGSPHATSSSLTKENLISNNDTNNDNNGNKNLKEYLQMQMQLQMGCHSCEDDSDSAIDAFRYDNSTFLDRLRKTETYETQRQTSISDVVPEIPNIGQFTLNNTNNGGIDADIGVITSINTTTSSEFLQQQQQQKKEQVMPLLTGVCGDKLKQLVEFYDLAQSNMAKISQDRSNNAVEIVDASAATGSIAATSANMKTEEQENELHKYLTIFKDTDEDVTPNDNQSDKYQLLDSLRPGLKGLMACMKYGVYKAFPHSTDITVNSLVKNLEFPYLKKEPYSARSFSGEYSTQSSKCEDFSTFKTTNTAGTTTGTQQDSEVQGGLFDLEEKFDSLAGIENFFTEINYNDFTGFDFVNNNDNKTNNNNNNDITINWTPKENQPMSLPFAESDDFWTNFTNISNENTDPDVEMVDNANAANTAADTSSLKLDVNSTKTTRIATTSTRKPSATLYTDAYKYSPPGVLVLKSEVDESFEDDTLAVINGENHPAYYCYNRFLKTSISITIIPLPDLLLNVSAYRELFHFYIHCASDAMVNYKDSFYEKLSRSSKINGLVVKNPFKYQLPAIAFENNGILTIVLAIAAALRQFKRNFEYLSFEDVGNLHKSKRSKSNLENSKSSLSKFNDSKLMIQNLVSRSFYELRRNIRDNIKQQENVIILFFITYLEKITCKKIDFKLVDFAQNSVYSAFTLDAESVFECFATDKEAQKLYDVSGYEMMRSCSNQEGEVSEFLEFLITWYSTIAIISGCVFKSPNVNREQISQPNFNNVLKTNLFKLDSSIDNAEDDGTNPLTANVRMPHSDMKVNKSHMFGLDTDLVEEIYKVMQLSKEKLHLINQFKSSRKESNSEFRDLFNVNFGLIGTALHVKNSMIAKFTEVINYLDELDGDDNGQENISNKVLKITNKLYVYAALLILYRRVIMIPRDSDIAQKFAKEIIKLVDELIELNNKFSNSDGELLTLFNGCLNFAMLCGALETLEFASKRKSLLKVSELSKKNFNLNSFLVFEIIQESYENCLPLSEIINKRKFSMYFY